MLRRTASLALVPLLSLLPLLVAAPACSSSSRETAGDEDTSELRALSAREILGDIAYGQTRGPVDYTSTPTYRAYRFQGSAGDQVEAWVRSDEGDARAWLVDARFKNVATNDDADDSTTNARVAKTLTASGAYYVVFREKSGDDATFTVSLTKTNGGTPTCDPEETNCPDEPPPSGNPNDPFSPASCAGPSLTTSQGLAMLDISRGVLQKKVGRFALKRRSRSCYPGQACSAWRDSENQITAHFATLNDDFTTDASDQRMHLNEVGDVIVTYEGNAPNVRVHSDDFHASWGASLTPTYIHQGIVSAPVAPGASGDIAMSVDYVWSPSRGCPNGHCDGNSTIPGSVAANWSGAALSVHGTVTSSCLRFEQSAAQSKKDTSNNDYRLESQLVILGNFATSSCVAKTCADVGFTCGALNDGCGGSLDCGACSNTQMCETQQGPSHCRPQTAAEECGRSGRVYCPGHGGCWDACF